MTVFELLQQIIEGVQADPEVRLAELEAKKADLEAEIQRVKSGSVSLMDDGAVRERFIQMSEVARDLLSDFREVDQNFRDLDRKTREQVARWEGSKGDLVHSILGARDAIGNSDQGRSFRAFWDFLMSAQKQEKLSELLETVLEIPAVKIIKPDLRLKRVHYDWLEAGEHTQRTVACGSRF